MTNNPEDNKVQENQVDQKNQGAYNKEKDPQNKPSGRNDDDDEIEYKPAKHPHEYINPTAEDDDTIEDERTDVEGGWDKKDDINNRDNNSTNIDGNPDEVNMRRERNDQNINHEKGHSGEHNIDRENTPGTENTRLDSELDRK